LNFLQSIYNSIKLSNRSSLNIKKCTKTPINSLILPWKIPPQVARPGYPLASPSVLILTYPDEGNSHLAGRGRKSLPIQVLIPKNIMTLKYNISFFIQTLDGFSTRQVKSLTTEIA